MANPEHVESDHASQAWEDALSDPTTLQSFNEGLVDLSVGRSKTEDEVWKKLSENPEFVRRVDTGIRQLDAGERILFEE